MEYNFFRADDVVRNKFINVPKIFFETKSSYYTMSLQAKMLYGILMERNSLSISNNWIDNKGNIYFYFDVFDLQTATSLTENTVRKYMKELVKYNLLHIKRQGNTKPNMYYLLQAKIPQEFMYTLIGKDKQKKEELKEKHNKRQEKYKKNKIAKAAKSEDIPTPGKTKKVIRKFCVSDKTQKVIRKYCVSRYANIAYQDTQILRTNYTKSSYTEESKPKVTTTTIEDQPQEIELNLITDYKEYFKALTKRPLTPGEKGAITRSKGNLSDEMVICAMDNAAMTAKDLTVAYICSILRRYVKDNILTIEEYIADIRRHDEAKRKQKESKKAITNTTKSPKYNKFNDYPQREYDFDELEDKLLGKVNSYAAQS